jgi:hypothetical protein
LDKSPEPTNITPDDLIKASRNGYISALYIIIGGSSVAFLFLLFAIFPADGGHGLGPNSVLFSILSFAVFAISCVISLITSGVGIVRGAVALSLKTESKDEIKDGIIKNTALILGIFLLMLIVYRVIT